MGSHTSGNVEHHDLWGNHSEMSADRQQTPAGQIWIISAGGTARGHDGYVIAGSDALSPTDPN